MHGALAAIAAAGCLLACAALPAGAAGAPRHHHATAVGQTQCPWLDQSQPISTRVNELIATMTLPDKVNLIEGHGSSNPYVFYEPAEPQYCIPQLGEEDGPNGVGDGLTGVTQLPAGVNLAATFSDPLARRYGTVVGSEEFGKGAAVNLGPTINIDRDPRWGRSFEAFTEDPFLNGALGSAEVGGIQSTGELDQLKHYAVYNQETYRNSPQDNAIVAERTLQEIYLKAFHTVVDTAAPASVMCSYATINGADACDNATLENGTLKTDWGFPGFITSDYGALHSTQGLLDGTDQEQPEPPPDYFSSLATNPSPAQVAAINTALSRVFTEMFRFNLFNAPPTGNVNSFVSTPAHTRIATQVAEASSTLLKNTGGSLPLTAAHAGTIAVIGPSADAAPTYGGGGSARVVPTDPVSPLAGLERAKGAGTRVSYTPGLPADTALSPVPAADLSPAVPGAGAFNNSYTGTLTAPETGTYVFAVKNDCGCYTPAYLSVNGTQVLDNPGTPPQDTYSVAVSLVQGKTYTIGLTGQNYSPPVLTWATPSDLAPGLAQAAAAAKAAKQAVVVVSDDTETEAADRLGLALPSAQDELVSAVTAANPHTVVVVEAGAPITMPWLSQAGAVLDTFYPGQVEGTALASVLFGKSDPSGHLPVTFPTDLSQVPTDTSAQFPGTGGKVQYSEGLNVGYRAYDGAQPKTPLFPFGYGLSYTSFRFSNLRIAKPAEASTGDVTVSAKVTNTGTRSGADVAQLYLTDPTAAGEPSRQLAGYQRVSLPAGRSTTVTFQVTPTSEQYWDTGANGWSTAPGSYGIDVGDSSAMADLPLHGAFTLARTPGSRQVSVTAPTTVPAGSPATVTVKLSAGGTATLTRVRLALQLPAGWTAQPLGRARFSDVTPGQALTTRFQVVAPGDSPNVNAVIHATAALGPDLTREAGAMTTVS